MEPAVWKSENPLVLRKKSLKMLPKSITVQLQLKELSQDKNELWRQQERLAKPNDT